MNKPKTIALNKLQIIELEDEIISWIEEYSIISWNNFDESLNVLGGFHSFSFSVEYSNGKKIIGKGSHSFPEKYYDVRTEIQDIFIKYIK